MEKTKIFEFNYFSKSAKNTFYLSPKKAIFTVKILIYGKFLILMQKRKIDFLYSKLN